MLQLNFHWNNNCTKKEKKRCYLFIFSHSFHCQIYWENEKIYTVKIVSTYTSGDFYFNLITLDLPATIGTLIKPSYNAFPWFLEWNALLLCFLPLQNILFLPSLSVKNRCFLGFYHYPYFFPPWILFLVLLTFNIIFMHTTHTHMYTHIYSQLTSPLDYNAIVPIVCWTLPFRYSNWSLQGQCVQAEVPSYLLRSPPFRSLSITGSHVLERALSRMWGLTVCLLPPSPRLAVVGHR